MLTTLANASVPMAPSHEPCASIQSPKNFSGSSNATGTRNTNRVG